jgi:AAA+ ATPase superfamily predicted ATPase
MGRLRQNLRGFKLPRKALKNRQLYILIFTSTLWLLVFISAVPTYSQTPKSTTQQSCESQIEKRAKQDAENDEIKTPQTEFAIKLYQQECPNLKPSRIGEIYDTAFQERREAKKKDLRELLKPENGWVAAIVLFLILIFKDTLTKWVSNFFEAVVNQIYGKLSGIPLLRGVALNRYREELKNKHQNFKISFRPNRLLKLKDIYVPLKVTGTNDTDFIDAFQAVAKYRRLVVKGSPGSGKTMLLKYIALCYADGRWSSLFNELQCIPILLELHRLSSSEKTVQEHLEDAFDRDGFPNAKHFVSESLDKGKLLLLFDGLDEVNSNSRERVVNEIKNLLDMYLKCPVIITCRTAVYRDEFHELVENTLEVAEFNDQQIRNFLAPWQPDMPADKSVEQLIRTLHDRPRIMDLARNPLMLTIIAYLYADTPVELPHSRAEFYRKATDILLEQWHQERNQFQGRDKKLILQHLALFFQDHANQQRQDRRSIDWKTVESEVKKILPNLNFQPETDTKLILKEIVERSGLLLRIDGGERYQFTDLTLQEFFAASKLRDNVDGLVSRFKTDPNTWRETLKLWCGIAEDSTQLIIEVRTVDPVVAFECLADAQKVDSTLASEIIDSFKSQLGINGNEDIVNHAFASVAADNRRRTDVFTFLKETLENTSETTPRRKAAADALSMTNLPIAAEILANQYNYFPEVRPLLVRMGDLAVPQLQLLAQTGVADTLDELKTIGTPLAISTLTSLIPVIEKKIEEIRSYPKNIIEIIKIEFNGKSGFFINQKENLQLKISNLAEKKISSLIFELDDTAKYNVEPVEQKQVEISQINVGEFKLIQYPLVVTEEGKITLQLKVNSYIYKPALEIIAVQNNPYLAGPPIEDTFNFFGRETEIQQIQNNILSLSGSHSMLIGEQRSGKTSLLYQIQNIFKSQFGYLPIYISFLGIERDNEKKALEWLLYRIVQEIKKNVHINITESISLNFSTDFIDYLSLIIDELKKIDPEYKLVLLLDEIQIITTINIKLQEILREAFNRLIKNLRVVIACYYNFFDDINANSSPFQNIFKYIHLKPLEGEYLNKLIVDPVSRLGYKYEQELIKEIKEISGGHPYYCQSLCATIFNEAKNSHEKIITHKYVESAKMQVLNNDKNRFKMGYWQNLKIEERLILNQIIYHKNITASNKIINKLANIFIIKGTQENFEFTATLFRDWCQQLINEEDEY